MVNPSSLMKINVTKCLAAVLLSQSANAQRTVDTELLLMIDVSGSVNASEYTQMMNGYVNAFRSGDVVDEIQAGREGSIAVALAFWSGNQDHNLAVSWTEISDTTSSENFANLIAGVTRPFVGSTAVGSAISYGANQFGIETGSADNGFVSAYQIIDFSGDGEDNDTPRGSFSTNEEAIRAARDQALKQGVDAINGLPIGGSSLNSYYENNVIGGSLGGVQAFSVLANGFADTERALISKLQREVGAAARASVSSVPEPSSALLGLVAIGAGLLRRRRI